MVMGRSGDGDGAGGNTAGGVVASERRWDTGARPCGAAGCAIYEVHCRCRPGRTPRVQLTGGDGEVGGLGGEDGGRRPGQNGRDRGAGRRRRRRQRQERGRSRGRRQRRGGGGGETGLTRGRACLPRTFLGGPQRYFLIKRHIRPPLGRYVHVSPRCKPHTVHTPHTRGTSAKNSRLLSPEISSLLLL